VAGYRDGANKATAIGATWVGLDNTTIGCSHQNAVHVQYTSGDIAEAAIWNVALSDEQVWELYEDAYGMISLRRSKTYIYSKASAGNPWYYYKQMAAAVGAA
jgi:hypothetical protein